MTDKKYEPWMPITDVRTLRILGKAAEEAAELCKALNRAIIQGLDGIDPHTGKSNITAILEEVVDTQVTVDRVTDMLELTDEQLDWMVGRWERKTKNLKEWQDGDLDFEEGDDE